MSKTKARMIGLVLKTVSVFPLYGGLITDTLWLSLAGFLLIIIGIVFYKVIKSSRR